MPAPVFNWFGCVVRKRDGSVTVRIDGERGQHRSARGLFDHARVLRTAGVTRNRRRHVVSLVGNR